MSNESELHTLAQAFKRQDLPESEVELTGEVPHEVILPYRSQALKALVAELELPGFRKGHVPEDLGLKKLGELPVLEEAVELLMRDFYPTLIEEHKLDVVGRPNISIIKLAPGNPVGIVIRAALYPEVSLPKNWKVLHEKVKVEATAEATDEEVQQTLESLQKTRTPKDAPTPELNDEFAKSLGAFESLDMLKQEIRKGIGEEKARAARDKRRGEIVDLLLDDTQVGIPNVFVESELEKIIGRMRDDVSRMGLTYEDYLQKLKKTEDDVRNEFRDQARKRAKLQLTLNKIAEVEKVEAEKEKVDEEMKHALEHFPDARPDLVRIHIETILRNEKVLELLEGTPQA